MKTTIKLLILCLACVLAIGGVMIYAKTKVTPPHDLKPVDQYALNINTEMSQLGQNGYISETDSVYNILINRVTIFNDENKISSQDSDKDIKKLLAIYSPKFLSTCFAKFNASVWDENDHVWMKDRINTLKSVKLSDDTQALNQSTLDSLNLVSNIITKYNDAKSISGASAFKGVSSARATINAADKYAEDPYLSNNTSLVNALKGVRSRIHDSHFTHVQNQVARLSGYRSMTESYYMNTLISQVEDALNDYDDNAYSLYGKKLSTSDLWSKGEQYIDDAENYYSNN